MRPGAVAAMAILASLALPMLAAAAQDGQDWPMYRSDAQHTGACDSALPASLRAPSVFNLSMSALTSPVASGGRVFACSADGTLYSVWADDGAPAWSRPLGANASSEPAGDGGRVYALDEAGGLHAFNSTTGAQAWNITLPGELPDPGYTLPLTFDSGSIYVSTSSGAVFRVAGDTGQVVWRSKAGDRMKGPVTVGGSLVYAVLEGGRAVALDAGTGNQSWSAAPGMGSSNEFTSAYVQGRLYIGNRGHDMFCLDTSSGSVVWNQSLKSTISGAPAIGGGIIVVGTQNGLVYALNISTGKDAWAAPYDVGADVTLSPALAGGMVLLGNDRGNLYMLDAGTGQLKASLALGARRVSSPAVSEGRILLTTADGALLIIGPVVSRPAAVLDISPARLSTGEPALFSGRNASGSGALPFTSYLFDFGDGTTSGWTGLSAVSHSYSDVGEYTVSLMVNDTAGNTSRFVYSHLVVANRRPSVSIGGPYTVDAGAPLGLSVSADDRDGHLARYELDIEGDGTVDRNGTDLPGNFTLVFKQAGNYRPNLTVYDDFGAGASATTSVLVREPPRPPAAPSPPAVSLPAAAASVSLVSLAAAGAGLSLTDFGKYRFFTLFIVPLYVRLKRDEVLDNYTRGRIMGYITANPGDNYNSIRDALELTNGIAAHHLHTLEREGCIQSMRDGMYRRFWPQNARLPPEDEGHFNIQKRIVAVIRESPGISQKEIAQKVGVSSPTVNYHIRVLETARMIYVKKFGRRTGCYVVEDRPQN